MAMADTLGVHFDRDVGESGGLNGRYAFGSNFRSIDQIQRGAHDAVGIDTVVAVH
jgi:hypothetical protein